MDLKCPMCKKKVSFSAKKCPYCLTFLDNNDEFITQRKVASYVSFFMAGVFVFLFLYLYFK